MAPPTDPSHPLTPPPAPAPRKGRRGAAQGAAAPGLPPSLLQLLAAISAVDLKLTKASTLSKAAKDALLDERVVLMAQRDALQAQYPYSP